MSVAARALLAASAIGMSGAAWAQVADATGENGAHAAPVSPVEKGALPAVGVRRVAAQTAAEPRLKLQAVERTPAPAADDVQPMDAEPASAAAASARKAAPAAPEPTPVRTEEETVMGPAPKPAPAAQAVAAAPPAQALAAAQALPQANAEVADAAAKAAPPPPPEPKPVLAEAAAAPRNEAAAAPAPAKAEDADDGDDGDDAAPERAPQAMADARSADDAAPPQAEPPAPPAELAQAPEAPPAAPVDPAPRLERAVERVAEPAPESDDPGIRQRVGFPRRSADAAAAFVRYMDHTSRIDAGLKSGEAVSEALHVASAYDARQLDEGMIAYGAMAALQSPTFVYGVMDMAANQRSRQQVVDTLLNDPAAAARLPGANQAAALADAAIAREGRRVVVSGKALKQAAYDVQLQPWSKLKPSDAERLAAAKAASTHKAVARDGDVAKLVARISSVQSSAAGGRAMTPVAQRSLALAALAVLDGADGAADRLDVVTSEPSSAECLKMAKLNLFQCLSVAGPEYEHVYCLGQHAVLDTGQCVTAASEPAQALVRAALPESDRSRVFIPMARMSATPQP